MKRSIVVFMICLFVLCAASVAFAAEARTSGLFTYEIKGNGTAVITDYDWKNHGKEDLYIPNMLDGYTITGIGDNAFQQQTEKRYFYRDYEIMAKLPESIVTIGEKAFFECNFIKTINIPASIKIIGAGAFAGTGIICNVDSQNETFATIDDVLYNKKDRELMFVPKGSATLLEETFEIPEGIESVGEYAFYHVGNKLTFVFPNTLRDIKDYAFCGVRLGLYEKNVFPESLEGIGKSSFSDVKGASVLDLQNTSITTIPESAFESASASEILLPKTIKTIGNCAFKDANASITMREGVESIGDEAFANIFGTITLLDTIESFKEITLPSTLKSIGDSAFANAERLEQITIPDSVNSIGENIVDRTKVTLVVTPGSYAETWATENGYMIAKQGSDDTSWLNYD